MILIKIIMPGTHALCYIEEADNEEKRDSKVSSGYCFYGNVFIGL